MTFLVPHDALASPEKVPGQEDSIGDLFENVTIEFALDPIGGAAVVENGDNWGIGLDGFNIARFWLRGARGQGTRIGIADSGMDSAHPAFVKMVTEGRLAAFAHFNKKGEKQLQRYSDGSAVPDAHAVPTFGHWHGTHCAAIMVGESTNGKDRGIAPTAELAVTRVLEQNNEGSVAGITAGLWWLSEQDCDIVSLSLGWPGLHPEWTAPILALLDAGVVVVAAVGNEYTTAGSPKSRSPANYLTNPAGDSSGLLISVGAHDNSGAVWDDSGGELVDWSEVRIAQTDGSSRPSIFATVTPRIVPSVVGPGVDIISAVPGDKYRSASGSSMATPIIAGLIAVVLSELRSRNLDARPRNAADLILRSMRDIPPPGPDVRSGGGRVDVELLVQGIEGGLGA